MVNIFDPAVTHSIKQRILQLEPDTARKWGKMDVAQMLAHCNVTYELVYDQIHPIPNGFMKWILKTFVKKHVVNEVAYKQSTRTAPQFIIVTTKDFKKEQQRLIDYIEKTQALGASYFEGKASHSFGKLTSQEWNNMFYKHLHHHLTQFGV